MTVQGSFPISMSDIASELRIGLPLSMLDARSLWLADLGAGPISMSSFAGKQAMKIVAITGVSSFGTSHTFSGTSFGADFSGRVLQVDLFAMTKDSAQTLPGNEANITNLSIGGAGPIGGAFGWQFWQGGTGSTTFVGQNGCCATPSGTSGTISFNTGLNTRCFCVVYAIANVSGTYFNGPTNDDSTNGSNINLSLQTPANGIMTAAAIAHSNNTIGMSGITVRSTFSPLSGYQVALAFDNRLGALNGRGVTITTSGSDASAATGGGLG